MPLFRVRIKRQVVEEVEVVVEAAEPQDVFVSVQAEYGAIITHADNVETWDGEMRLAWVDQITKLDPDTVVHKQILKLPSRHT